MGLLLFNNRGFLCKFISKTLGKEYIFHLPTILFYILGCMFCIWINDNGSLDEKKFFVFRSQFENTLRFNLFCNSDWTNIFWFESYI